MSQVGYNVWLEKPRYDEVERVYQEHLQMLKTGGCAAAGACTSSSHAPVPGKSSLACEIARAREHIQKSLCGADSGAGEPSLVSRIDAIEKENKELRKIVEQLRSTVTSLTSRVSVLEKGCSASSSGPVSQPAAAKKQAQADENGDDDFELFGSDDDDEVVDEEAERIRQERVKAYESKKANKTAVIAKSNIILDVKPWDDETDMSKVEECVRSIAMDGLLWGASKLVPLAYGIKKLQISCVVEDDKVSTDDLEEQIVAFEDYIQSMDIAAFNKI